MTSPLKQLSAETQEGKSSRSYLKLGFLVALLTCSLAVSLHLDNFVIEGDSSTIITDLQNPSLIMDWHLDHVICNIFFLLF
jgi:hypothetical protein